MSSTTDVPVHSTAPAQPAQPPSHSKARDQAVQTSPDATGVRFQHQSVQAVLPDVTAHSQHQTLPSSFESSLPMLLALERELAYIRSVRQHDPRARHESPVLSAVERDDLSPMRLPVRKKAPAPRISGVLMHFTQTASFYLTSLLRLQNPFVTDRTN